MNIRKMSTTNSSWIKTVSLPRPSLQDNTADAERLISALRAALQTNDAIHVDFGLLKKMPATLRTNDFNVRCILLKDAGQWLVLGIQGATDMRPVAGLAVDLGTTRVVLRLLDLANGRILAESGFDNPQLTVGPDILTRIHFTESSGGLTKLNDLIITGLNKAIGEVCQSTQTEPEDIYTLAVAGNTTMTHLFLGLNPRWIIREPYIPAVNKPGILKATELGLQVNSAARVRIFRISAAISAAI